MVGGSPAIARWRAGGAFVLNKPESGGAITLRDIRVPACEPVCAGVFPAH